MLTLAPIFLHMFKPSEDEWTATFEQSPIGIGFLNTKGQWIKVNPALCRLVEFTEDELFHLTSQSLTHPQDIQSDLAMLTKLEKDELQGYEMLKRYLTKTGKVVWVRTSVWPIKNELHKVMHYVTHVQPLLNGERAKMEKVGENKVEIRPTISVGEFIKDNIKAFLAACVITVTTLVGIGVAVYSVESGMQDIKVRLERQEDTLIHILNERN